VQVRCIVHVTGHTAFIELDVKHPFGDDPPIARAGSAGVLDGVLEVKQDPRLRARVPFIDQDGAALEKIPVPLQRQVDDGVEEWMAGTDESGEWLALRRNE